MDTNDIQVIINHKKINKQVLVGTGETSKEHKSLDTTMLRAHGLVTWFTHLHIQNTMTLIGFDGNRTLATQSKQFRMED